MAPKGRVLRDRRRSTRHVHVGKVTVFHRGASWYIYYRESGKAKRIRIGPDKAEAERRAAEVNAQLAHGVPSTYGFVRISVADLRQRWLDHHDLVLRSSVATVCRYRAATEHLLTFLAAEHPQIRADCLTPGIAEDFVKYLRGSEVGVNGHVKARKRRMRDKGVVFILSTCRSMLNYAARQRFLPPYARNPFSELSIERMRIEDSKPTDILAPEEEVRFLKACDRWQLRIFATLAFTGMRPGELCHLLLDDVDWDNRLLHIRNRPELGWKTKTRNERRVYLVHGVLDAAREAAGERTEGPLFLARKYADGLSRPPLASMDATWLASELQDRTDAASASSGDRSQRELGAREAKHLWRDMGATNPRDLRREFMRVTKRMGRAELTCPKLWRHQMTTAMQEAAVDPIARKEIVGHTQLSTTSGYTHTRAVTLRTEMGKVAALRTPALQAVRQALGR